MQAQTEEGAAAQGWTGHPSTRTLNTGNFTLLRLIKVQGSLLTGVGNDKYVKDHFSMGQERRGRGEHIVCTV